MAHSVGWSAVAGRTQLQEPSAARHPIVMDRMQREEIRLALR